MKAALFQDEIAKENATLAEQEKALISEIQQETGIDISKITPEKIDEFEVYFEATENVEAKKVFRRLVHLFLVRIPEAEEALIKVNETKNEKGESEDKHAGYKWLSPEELIEATTVLKENNITKKEAYPLSRNSRHIKKLIEAVK